MQAEEEVIIVVQSKLIVATSEKEFQESLNKCLETLPGVFINIKYQTDKSRWCSKRRTYSAVVLYETLPTVKNVKLEELNGASVILLDNPKPEPELDKSLWKNRF